MGWITLEELRKGAIFETEDGVRAVKSEYRYTNDNPQPMCILLASGEFAHFLAKERTLVREVASLEHAAQICKELTDRRVAEMGLTAEGAAHLTGYQCVAAIRALI